MDGILLLKRGWGCGRKKNVSNGFWVLVWIIEGRVVISVKANSTGRGVDLWSG